MRAKNEFVLGRKVTVVEQVGRARIAFPVVQFVAEPFVHVRGVKQFGAIALVRSPVEHFERANVIKFADHSIVRITDHSKQLRVLVGIGVGERKQKGRQVPPANMFGPCSF